MDFEQVATVIKETKGDISKMLTEHGQKTENHLSAMQSQIDDLAGSWNKAKRFGGGAIGGNSFDREFKSQLESHKSQLELLRKHEIPKFGFELKTMTLDGLTGDPYADQRSDIKFEPNRRFHFRQIIPTGTTSNSLIKFPYEVDVCPNVEFTSEAALKPRSDADVGIKTVEIVKIADSLKISEEMLSDFDFMRAYVSSRFSELLLRKEDEGILGGNGSPPELDGLAGNASSYIPMATYALDHYLDHLTGSLSQIRKAGFEPDALIVSPEVYDHLIHLKSEDGMYLLPSIFTGQDLVISGVRVYRYHGFESPTQWLAGDFGMGCQLFYRQGLNVRFYDQNEDDAIHNLWLVILEERLALAVYHPNAFVFDDLNAFVCPQTIT